MKKALPYLIIAFLIVLLFFTNSKKNTAQKPIFITVPKIDGSFEASKPIQLPLIQKPLGQILSKKETIYVAENNKLLKEFQQENESLKKELLFKKAIQLNTFTSNFEDENVILNIAGIVQGELKEVTPTYTIKAKKVVIQPKQVKFRLLAGVEIGNTLVFDKPLFKANVGFQNAKGNQLTVSYDSEERIFVGYNFTVFKIRR